MNLWDTKETAERIGWSERSLERARIMGNGPPYVRVGLRRVMYQPEAVQEWLAARTYAHRADELARSAA